MFEAERALARAIVEDNALTAADRPRIREMKKGLVEGGRAARVRPDAGGPGSARRPREAQEVDRDAQGRLPSGRRREAARSAQGHPAAGRPGLRQEPRGQGDRADLGTAAACARRRPAARAVHRRVRAQPARRPAPGRAHGALRALDRRDREGLRLGRLRRVRRRRLQAPHRHAPDLDAGARRARLPRRHGELRRTSCRRR